MMEDSHNELKEYANKRIPLPKKDLSEKDNDLLKKMTMLAQALEIPKPPVIGYDVSEKGVIFVDKRRVGD